MHTFYLARLYLLLSLFSLIFPMFIYKITMYISTRIYICISMCAHKERSVFCPVQFRHTFKIWEVLHILYFFTDMVIPEKWQRTEDPQSILNARSIQYQCTKISISVLKEILQLDFNILRYLFLSRTD